MTSPFGDAGDARFMVRNPLDDNDSMRLRRQLATRPEFSDLSRMSDAHLRRQVEQLQSQGRLFAEHAQVHVRARPSVQTEHEPLAAAAVAVAHTPAPKEKRYPLFVVLSYDPTPTVCTHKVLAVRCKWEHDVTGSETRRSGVIKPGDAARSDVRCREMLAGDHRLEFKNDKKFQEDALHLRAIKAKRN